ncbi:methylmalonyl-CoA epimerase [Altererythrobacter aurantiacus]|uniref:Methylmalonyl-CoA epimerase n=1 Tax=Parapontixanthobacter aurantiacus TaxID=1463599 RepID=A0A844ZH88_9SPHN|nr:methylmalonyl-CoA epimerase [Parapontixanthobacter aurantiacus]MXO85089.1 methylmalonyl-CoA epimerase [Parapontixanthobacter aurantiacus]
MKLGRLNHIGVATPSIEESLRYYRDTMGAVQITEPFDLPEQGVTVCFVDTPDSTGEVGKGTQIELIEPLGETSTLNTFMEKNPLGGQHHVCYEVEDIEEARHWFEGRGKRILGPTRIGAHGTPIFFLHPKDMMGQLTEIMETPKKDAH